MTPPRSITSVLATSGRPWRRRLILLALAALFLLLAFYPERYRGVVLLAPQSANAVAPGQPGGAYASMLGTQQTIEIDLSTARSTNVASDVIGRLKLLGQDGFEDRLTALRTLERKVAIKALRGGIVEISAIDGDANRAVRLADAYARATQARLAAISRAQIDAKRRIVTEHMDEARARLTLAKASPQEIASAQSLYDSYARYLESTAIEDLTADFNLQLLEESHIDPDRQYSTIFLALFLLTIGLAVLIEIHLLSPRASRRPS